MQVERTVLAASSQPEPSSTGGGQDDVEGMSDTPGVHEDGDGIRVTDLPLQVLGLGAAPWSWSRSKTTEKEKGKPTRCRCDRSGCLKRYCVCFAAGGTCAPDCKCKDCKNDDSTEERRAARAAAVAKMLKKKSNAFTPRVASGASIGTDSDQLHTSGCNCKKSGCRLRYCECFQAGVRCHEKCKCFDCLNPAGSNPLARSLQGATKHMTIVGQPDQARLARLGLPGATLVRRDSAETSVALALALHDKFDWRRSSTSSTGGAAAAAAGAAAAGAGPSTVEQSAEAPAPPAATSIASAATPSLSSSERAQLMQRLEEHMAAHGASQKQVASAAGLSDAGLSGTLSMWLGRSARNTLWPTETAEIDALIAAYLNEAPVPLAAVSASAATPNASAASSTEHAQLVERLEKHMAAHRLSQLQMAKALKVPSCDIVSRWLGCARDPLPAATEAETDARITAYLDAYIPPAPIFAASAASTASPALAASPASPALAASPAVPLVSTEHAQLVERLEEHMVAHRLSQTLVAKALKFASAGKLSLWLGRCRQQTLGAATILEVDARIAAYLDGWEMPQAQAAPPLKRLLEATLPAAAPKQKNWRNKGVGETKWARRKRLKQKTPMLTAVRGGNRYTVDQSGGCSPGANPSPSPNPSPNPNPNQRRRRRRARTTPSPRPSYFRSPRTGRRLASLRLLRRSATAALRVCGSAAAGSAHATRVAAALRARRGAA